LISFVDENNSYSEEASDYRWVSINDLKDEIKLYPEKFTECLKIAIHSFWQ